MRTLSRAVAVADAVGKEVKLPYAAMRRMVNLHTKELVVIAAAPGAGKSVVAVNMAMGVDYPVLYFAQDSPSSVKARMVALASPGLSVRQAHGKVADPTTRQEIADLIAKRVRDTLIVQTGAVNIDQIEKSIDALTEWIGEAPPLVIIDNLIDMIVPGYNPSENGFFATVLPALKQMAIRLDTCIVVLHHVSRASAGSKGRSGITMKDLLFAGEREARHVWGVFNDGEARMNLQILKQQDGRADPEGEQYVVPLSWHPETGKLSSTGI